MWAVMERFLFIEWQIQYLHGLLQLFALYINVMLIRLNPIHSLFTLCLMPTLVWLLPMCVD